MIRRPPRSTLSSSSAASDVYKRQPFIGVFFYIFFGRDWKVVAQRKGWIQTLRRVESEEMAPIYARNAAAGERFEREWAGTIALPISRAIASENVSQILPAASVELFVTGKAKFA